MANKNNIVSYIESKREEYHSILLSKAEDVASEINSILEKGDIDLLKNAEWIAFYVVEGNEDDLIAFAEDEGVAWAKRDLTLSMKLEWIHAIRRTLWQLLNDYHRIYDHSNEDSVSDFFKMEKQINDGIDRFLNNFFMSYSRYKDEEILEQRKLVEHLTVPIIPLNSTVAVFPLIGKFDDYRMDIIQEKVLSEVMRLEIETLLIDLSGVADIDAYNLASFERVLSGVSLMGSSTILTGLSPQLAKKMASFGTNFKVDFRVKGTLYQALNELLHEESYE